VAGAVGVGGVGAAGHGPERRSAVGVGPAAEPAAVAVVHGDVGEPDGCPGAVRHLDDEAASGAGGGGHHLDAHGVGGGEGPDAHGEGDVVDPGGGELVRDRAAGGRGAVAEVPAVALDAQHR